jgi:hypothetical protein
LLWIRYLEAKGYVDLDLFLAGMLEQTADFGTRVRSFLV